MIRLGTVLFSAFCLLAVTGCGAGPDSLAEQAIAETNKLAEAYETDKPEAERNKIEARLKEVNDKLEKLSDDEKERLKEKYGDKQVKAFLRLQVARGKGVFDAAKKMFE